MIEAATRGRRPFFSTLRAIKAPGPVFLGLLRLGHRRAVRHRSPQPSPQAISPRLHERREAVERIGCAGMAEAATPPPDPAAIMRSRQFIVLLVLAAIVGVVSSLAAWCFLER